MPRIEMVAVAGVGRPFGDILSHLAGPAVGGIRKTYGCSSV
jgi:hypothetical protein